MNFWTQHERKFAILRMATGSCKIEKQVGESDPQPVDGCTWLISQMSLAAHGVHIHLHRSQII
jgi:hypothetical protein